MPTESISPSPIKHIWFDFSETIAFLKKERHDRLRYETYAQVVGSPVSEELIQKYENLYEKQSHSNSAIFNSLGKSSNFWSECVNSVEPSELYVLTSPSIPDTLKKIMEFVPISLFSNINLEKVLVSLGINQGWFTHILSAGMVKQPKPALDGFYKMVELSGIPAYEILYIGDHIGKDVRPAKQVGIKAGLMWKKSDEADYSFQSFEEILDLFKKQ